MASLGTMKLGFAVQTAGLGKGLKTARGMLSDFQGSVTSVKGALGGLAAAAGATFAVAKLTEWTKASMDSVDAMGKAADRVGTSTEALAGFTHAASMSGSSTEEATKALEKMSDVLAASAGKDDNPFSRLGLDAKKLQGMDPVDVVGQIADRINALPNASERAAAAMDVFGKSGVNLLNTLGAGSEGLKAAREEAERLGLTFSRVDAAQVEMANDALTRVGKLSEGIGNQLAIQLAPYVEALATKFLDFATSGMTAGEIVSTGLDWVASGLGVVADVVDVVLDGFKFLRAISTKAFAEMAANAVLVARGLDVISFALTGASGGFEDLAIAIRDDLTALGDEQWADAMESFTAAPPSEGIRSFFDDVKDGAKAAAEAIANASNRQNELSEGSIELGSKVADLTAGLREQIETFGMSSIEAQLHKLALEGASEAELAEARSLAEQLSAMEASAKAREDLEASAKSVIESTRTPMEQYLAETEKLRTLLDEGLIDSVTFDRAEAEARKGLGSQDSGPRFASAMEFGSDEARSTLLRNLGMGTDQPMDKVAENTKATAAESKTQTGLLRQLVKAMGSDDAEAFPLS